MVDSGATSTVGKPDDEFILTEELSHKVLEMPTVEESKAITKYKCHHKVRESEITVDMLPNFARNSLLSARKFSDAKCVTVLIP